jgi:hypothetical protein
VLFLALLRGGRVLEEDEEEEEEEILLVVGSPSPSSESDAR